jgi:hypothetical protein
MASRRVSISALLCEDDAPVPTLSPTRQRHPPRRTPSPDPSSHYWPPPPSSRHYEPEPSYMPPSSSSPRPSYSQSQSPYSTTRLSSHSPASTCPPSVHSPSSPLLYTQRHAPSPASYSHSPPSSGASHYDPSFQPTVSPTLRHHRYDHHAEPTASSSMHPPSLSRISATSSSSFPQALLNPVSPQQPPLGGLEALVQAAVVERDRLEAKASLDRKTDASRSTVRRSPELFRSSHESSRTHLQAPAPRTPITPSLISGPLLRDSYSESSLRTGPGPEVHPSKRQRPSDSHPGPDHSWDSPPPWDSSSQFTGLIGPGIKPRRRSSDVRTEMRPTVPIPSWDKEEASVAASRVSPTRERSVRRQYSTEEKSSRSHVPSYREPATSTIFAPDDIQHVFAAEGPRFTVHQDLRPNIDLHPPPKVLLSDLLLEKHDRPPSPPPPRPLFKLVEPPVPPAPAPRPQSSPPTPARDDGCSPQAHPSPRNDTPVPTATAAQNFVEMKIAASLEQSMDSTVPSLPPLPGASAALVESLPPDNLPTAVQNSPVFITSSSISNVHDSHLGPAVPVKSQSLPPPAPDPHDADIALAIQDVQSPVGISRLSSPPREDVPNPPSSEQEPRLPPTTASPSPRAASPASPSFQDVVSADQPVRPRMTSASETSHVNLVTELQNPAVDAPISVTSVGEPEAVKSPAAFPPAVEAVALPKPDGSPRADEAPIPVVNVIKSEAAQELGVAIDANQFQDTEQRDTDMDVDEELLSLIADDLPSRHSQNTLRKQEPSPSEIKHSPCSHAPPKQEPVLSTLPPSHPSPGPGSLTIKSERVSTLSPDAAAFTRDPEASTLKPEERPPQKKKVNQLVLGFLLVFLTSTRQNSMHSPKVVPNQTVRQSRSSKYHPMVS